MIIMRLALLDEMYVLILYNSYVYAGSNLGFELSLDCPNDPDDPDSDRLHVLFASKFILIV